MAFVETTLPFIPSELRFGNILEQKYIRQAVIWLLRQKGAQIVDSVPVTSAEQDHCSWAVALYVESFLNAQIMPDVFTKSERRVLVTQALRLGGFLLENQMGNGSWENNCWDTSAISRVMLLLMECAKTCEDVDISKEFTNQIEKAVKKAVNWLVIQTLQWESVRYPYGPQDLAMVIRLLYVIDKYGYAVFPKRTAKSISTKNLRTTPRTARELIEHLVESILRQKIVEVDPSINEETVHWNTPLATAQVVQVIAETIPLLPIKLQGESLIVLAKAISYMEETQVEGRWGSLPQETMLMLQAYVDACHTINQIGRLNSFSINARPEIIFKSLRWLTDEKQRFPDGSILHVYTHTAWFVLTLQHLSLCKLNLLDYPVNQLYDYVLWDSQIRPSLERAERIKLTEKLIMQNREIINYTRFYNAILNSLRVLITLIAGGIMIYMLSILDWISLESRPFAFHILQPEAFLTSFGLYASLASAFWIYSRRLIKQIDTDSK